MILPTALNSAVVTGTGEGGSGLTPIQDQMLTELWQLRGLDENNPTTITDTSIQFDTVDLSVDNPDANTTTITRQP